MIKCKLFLTLISSILLNVYTYSQHIDSTLESLQQIPAKYITGIDKKVDLYTSRITSKTEKTLTKLSRWENKIKGLLEKTSPETATRLFGNNQLTFTSLLQQLKNGEAIALQYQAPYNKYRDEVTTSLKYLSQQKEQLDSSFIKKIKSTSNKMQQMATEEDKVEAMQQFIKERKKQIMEQAFSQIGKSKYLKKINKEAYYYTETLKNYKELFSDSRKAEKTATTILNSIPAFQKFMQRNSMFASLFGRPEDIASAANIAGLQTRASVQTLLQDRIASGGPNAQQMISENMQAAQSQINQMKNKLINKLKVGGDEVSEFDFSPNMQKTKTLLQRLEFGSNIQFVKGTNLFPGIMEVAATAGYRLNDKSTTGLGLSYQAGLGNIQHIAITHQGVGLRSFMDWKLKKQFFIAGGYELNHNAAFTEASQLQKYDAWQHLALLGVTKKINIKTKWTQGTNIQLLYNFLHNRYAKNQPVLFRVGYTF